MADKKRRKDAFDYISPFTRRYIKPITDWCFQSKFHMFLVLMGIVLAIIFASLIKKTMIISLLILLGGISKIYQRYIRGQVGIEFIMLATTVSGYVYGSLIGGIVGFTTFALATYFSGRWSHNLFPSFIMVTIVGMLAPLFNNGNVEGIITAGVLMTLVYDIILFYIYIAWFRGRLHKITLFVLTHFFWNLWVFTKLAPLVVEALV